MSFAQRVRVKEFAVTSCRGPFSGPHKRETFQYACRNFGDRSDEIYVSFTHAGKALSLPGGLTAASSTTLGIRQMLSNPQMGEAMTERSTSPLEVYGTTDGVQAMYCHLLCALAGRARVRKLSANFLIHVVSGIQFLEKHWPRYARESLFRFSHHGPPDIHLIPKLSNLWVLVTRGQQWVGKASLSDRFRNF